MSAALRAAASQLRLGEELTSHSTSEIALFLLSGHSLFASHDSTPIRSDVPVWVPSEHCESRVDGEVDAVRSPSSNRAGGSNESRGQVDSRGGGRAVQIERYAREVASARDMKREVKRPTF